MDSEPRKRDNQGMRRADKSAEPGAKRFSYPPGSCKLILLATAIYLCVSGAVLAQTPDSQDNGSWTATTESKEDNANPTRTIRSHTQNGNRTVDVQSLQTRGADGNLNPYQDIETETVRVSATTTRTTTRTFVRDSTGTKTLFQITEEEKQNLSGGDSKVVRTTSNPDANGNLQVVQRENRETRKTGPDSQETKATVMLPGINGGLAPAMQTEERQKNSGNKVEIQKTTLLPNSAGGWQAAEVRHTTIENEGKNRTKEERVSRPDPEGNLTEVSRTVSKESQDASGDGRKSEETYSIDQPGAARDGGLHLVQRVTTTQRTNSAGQQATKVAEQPNPGDPGAGLVVTTVTKETVRLGTAGGAQATETIQLSNADGNLSVVSVDTTKADNAHAVEIQIAPAKPK
jgi:hypothetical protein